MGENKGDGGWVGGGRRREVGGERVAEKGGERVERGWLRRGRKSGWVKEGREEIRVKEGIRGGGGKASGGNL